MRSLGRYGVTATLQGSSEQETEPTTTVPEFEQPVPEQESESTTAEQKRDPVWATLKDLETYCQGDEHNLETVRKFWKMTMRQYLQVPKIFGLEYRNEPQKGDDKQGSGSLNLRTVESMIAQFDAEVKKDPRIKNELMSKFLPRNVGEATVRIIRPIIQKILEKQANPDTTDTPR